MEALGLFDDEVDAASWKNFSLLVLQARKALAPTSANESLLAHQPVKPESHLRALFRFWAADNLRRAMRFEEAIELCDSFAANFPGAEIGDRSISPQVDLLVASCQRSLGLYGDAVGSLVSLAAATPEPGPAAELLLRAGIWAEAVPELRESALEAYRRATVLERKAKDEHGLARRQLQRLENAGQISFAADPETLAMRLARLLRAKDARGLFDLASPTHFSIGIGCHRFFVEPGEASPPSPTPISPSTTTIRPATASRPPRSTDKASSPATEEPASARPMSRCPEPKNEHSAMSLVDEA